MKTINIYFNEVMRIICSPTINAIKSKDPEFINTPREIAMNLRFMPHFKVILIYLFIIEMVNINYLDLFFNH